MKILIDISRLHPAALKRGIGFYCLNLYDSLKNFKDNNDYYLIKNKNYQIDKDIIHYPYFDPYFLTLPVINKKPVIITVHDITPLKFPQFYPVGIRGKIKWKIQKYLLNKASAIITDSQNSKQDIIDIIGYPKEKIYPIYLGVDKQFKKMGSANWRRKLEISKKYSLPEDFLLYVGDINWNKNIKGLIKAFYKVKGLRSKVNSGTKNLKLILIGEAFKNDDLKERQEINQLLNDLKIKEEVIFLGFIPIADLVAIYNLAVLYVQPSFYEGFGLPILEAMNCGCPVLSSNQGSLPEIGERAVEYFNPYKQEEFEYKLIHLLKDKAKLILLSEMGIEQAKKFNWQKTAIETKGVYKKVISENK